MKVTIKESKPKTIRVCQLKTGETGIIRDHTSRLSDVVVMKVGTGFVVLAERGNVEAGHTFIGCDDYPVEPMEFTLVA